MEEGELMEEPLDLFLHISSSSLYVAVTPESVFLPPPIPEDFIVFQNLMRRVATSLGVQVELVHKNPHVLLDILQTPAPGRVTEASEKTLEDSSFCASYSQENGQTISKSNIKISSWFFGGHSC